MKDNNEIKRFNFRIKRVRSKIKGTHERPRLAVYRSNKHLYAQIIDDTVGKTIISTSTISKEFKKLNDNMNSKIDISKMIGTILAKKSFKHGIKKVVFDRRGYKYTGKIKILANAARINGLEF
ncbi:MAG: 50S ribosomal protein L18 [Endomicrobium sp.]|jgi:large subunit ribosomal protein L18|nr:50S ribosomal protein L18 [Endomicrobium sp.]